MLADPLAGRPVQHDSRAQLGPQVGEYPLGDLVHAGVEPARQQAEGAGDLLRLGLRSGSRSVST